MSQTIGEVNINLRMSLAAFKQDVKNGSKAASDASKGMADAVGGSSREAKASLALIGEEIGVTIPRHIRGFITQLPAVASGLTAAFSAIAVVALAEVVVKSIEKIKELATEIGGFGKEAQAAYAKVIEGNKQALKFAEDLKVKYRELALIGLTGADRDAKQRALNTLSQAEAQGKLTAGLQRQREIEKQIADYEGQGAGFAFFDKTVGSVTRLAGITEATLPKLNKELEELRGTNEELRKSLQTTNYKAKADDTQAFANATNRAAEAQKKLSEILFKVYQDRAKIQTIPVPNKGVPDIEGDAFSAITPKTPPSFLDTFGKALEKQNETVLAEAAKVYEATRTSAEKYGEEVQHLTDLLNQGVISQDTFNRGVNEAKNKYDDVAKSTEEFGASIAATIKQGSLFGSSWKQELESIGVEILQLVLKMTLLKNVTQSSLGGGFLGSLAGGLFNLPFKASGGPVLQGNSYVVGDHGPEVFTPDTSGRIIPNNQLKSGGAGSTAPVVNNFVQHIHGVTDVDGFRKSSAQIAADALAMMGAAGKRNR